MKQKGKNYEIISDKKFISGFRGALIVGFLGLALYGAIGGVIEGLGLFSFWIFGLMLIPTAMYYYFWSEVQKGGDFYVWLLDHKDQLLGGDALVYGGKQITKDTTYRTFHSVFSFIFFTHEAESRLLVDDVDPIWLNWIAYTGATLLFGWWGIPWGPIYTVRAIVRNTLGGKRVTLEKIVV